MSSEFSDVEIEIIKTFVVQTIGGRSDPRVSRDEVYEALKASVGTKLTKNQFVAALSAAINEDLMSGITISKGRYGGIKLKRPDSVAVTPALQAAEPEEQEETLPEINAADVVSSTIKESLNIKSESAYLRPPPVKHLWNQPAEEEKYTIRIRETTYRVPSVAKMKNLLVNVIEAKEDPEGFIELDGIKYTCDEVAAEYLDKFVFYHFEGTLRSK